jgi:hypothetical protein
MSGPLSSPSLIEKKSGPESELPEFCSLANNDKKNCKKIAKNSILDQKTIRPNHFRPNWF